MKFIKALAKDLIIGDKFIDIESLIINEVKTELIVYHVLNIEKTDVITTTENPKKYKGFISLECNNIDSSGEKTNDIYIIDEEKPILIIREL